MIDFKNKNIRAIILVMVALVVATIAVSKVYYSKQNASVDPRVVEARELYEKYNSLVANNNLNDVFNLLDSIEDIYSKYNYYRESFEVGVLYNNRAAAYLTFALSIDSITALNDTVVKDSLLNLSDINVRKSISIYENWIAKYGDMEESQLFSSLKKDFFPGWEGLTESDRETYLKNRLQEMLDAQFETKRRLSVSYTNLGIIYKHKEKYQDAALSYEKAINLWDRNLTAENNLNILLGRPLVKRNFIQKMFPPKREENKK